MESNPGTNLGEIMAVSEAEGKSIPLLTTLSLAIKVLPYFGYADQCKTLMTQLRSESRQLWLSNEDQWLKPFTNDKEEEVFHMKKRILLIKNFKGPSSSGDKAISYYSQIMNLAHSGAYKLYSFNFWFDDEDLLGIETIADFCQKVDLDLLKVKKINVFVCINTIPEFEWLLTISRALKIEVREYKVDKATYYKFKYPPFCVSETRCVDSTKNLYVCSYDWESPNNQSEQDLIGKLQNGFIDLPELVECFRKLFEITTMETFLKEIKNSSINIRPSHENIVRDKDCIPQLSEILDNHTTIEDCQRGFVPTFWLYCKRLFKDQSETMQPNDLDLIPTLSNVLNNKGFPIQLVFLKTINRKTMKSLIEGDKCLIGYSNWTMEMTDFMLEAMDDCTIDNNCIVFGSNNNNFKANVYEKASFNNLEEHKSSSEDIKIYIPTDEIKSLGCDFGSLRKILSVGSIQKLSELKIKISPIDLSKECTCEIFQNLPKFIKVGVEIIDPEPESDQQEQNNEVSFEALQNLNLKKLKIGYEISNEDLILSLISFLEHQTTLNGTSVKIRASEIEDVNSVFKSLLGAICDLHYLDIDISVSEATPEIIEMSKEFAKSNIDKNISIRLNPPSERSDPTENLENTNSDNPITKSQECSETILITDKFAKLWNKLK
ncbi:unnamed protein product [Moneuplotes crassus]|uniref:Uncharacterized protein n=1 Tax=Euplotes crassus TaxID=5936 RepID=A0AAD1U3A1_EUPCR|nr:unnamed protein product [Moneuplotes crassus]